MTKVVLFVALLALLVGSAACMPPPVAPAATATPRATATLEMKAAPIDTASPPSSPTPRAAETSKAATIVPEVFSLVEDCMAACHIPDPSEYYDAGAMAKPADHAGRTTCLECHSKPTTAKALPDTHLGRLDPACSTCHK